MAPLLVIVIAVAGFVVGSRSEVRSEVLAQVSGVAGSEAAESVGQLIDNRISGRSGIAATIVGVITLLIGATGAFGQLKSALNTIWEVEPPPRRGFWQTIRERFLSFTLIVGVSFLLLVSLVVSAGLSFADEYFTSVFGFGGLVHALNVTVSLGVVTVLFATMFKVLPDVKMRWRDVWVGSLFTALLFTAGRELIGLYLGTVSISSVYGAAGSLVIILLWVYYSAQILFFGAEFTQVYARYRGGGPARQRPREQRARCEPA